MLPDKYKWLHSIVPPRVIREALALYGTTEIPGPKHSNTILAWARELEQDLSKVYTRDEIPWCGLFVAVVVERADKKAIKDPLWARNWANWGANSPEPGLGDVMVFSRPGGGGHVAFYVAEDETAYHVIGGNQSDMVNITRVAKNRCIAARRPIWKVAQPKSVKPYYVTSTGRLSTNEA